MAGSLLDILYDRYAARPILIHGFSVGGYLWGEVQLKMSQDLAKYEQLIQNITGWSVFLLFLPHSFKFRGRKVFRAEIILFCP